MHGFSEMVWATMGPPGELFDQAMQHDYSAVIAWLETQCERAALDPEAIGETIYAAADSGQVTLGRGQAAAADRAQRRRRHDLHHHGQRAARLGRVPGRIREAARRSAKVRAAFDESLRWDARAAWPAASPRARSRSTTTSSPPAPAAG
jgi:hypothetical protein